MTPDELRRLADEDWALLDRIEYDRDRLRGAADDWEADRKRLALLEGEEVDGRMMFHLCDNCTGKLDEKLEPIRKRLAEAAKEAQSILDILPPVHMDDVMVSVGFLRRIAEFPAATP